MALAYGAAYPAGVFIPTIAAGACLGGCCGNLLVALQVAAAGAGVVELPMRAAPYALVGAVALLGGVLRSSLSLVVIILEGTGAVNNLLPIIVTTVCAKWMGDQLNHGLYHTALASKRIPFMESGTRRSWELLTAADAMAAPVVCLRVEQPVDDLLALLAASDHQGFPVEADGSFVGLVLRQHLYALLAGGQFSRAAAPADADADAADGASGAAREAAAAAQRRSATSEDHRLSSDDLVRQTFRAALADTVAAERRSGAAAARGKRPSDGVQQVRWSQSLVECLAALWWC